MRLLPIFLIATVAASGISTENNAPVNVQRRSFGDESHVERRGWSMRSMIRKALKKMHVRVSNRYISQLMKKYNTKTILQMLKSIKFGEE